MKSHASKYQDWLIDQSVEQYCALQIDPYQVEIEDLGINALIDAIVHPAGMVVEILYLDRSAGAEANTIKFEREKLDDGDSTSSSSLVPAIRLLYRPLVQLPVI